MFCLPSSIVNGRTWLLKKSHQMTFQVTLLQKLPQSSCLHKVAKKLNGGPIYGVNNVPPREHDARGRFAKGTANTAVKRKIAEMYNT
jgi:hypothetical protein